MLNKRYLIKDINSKCYFSDIDKTFSKLMQIAVFTTKKELKEYAILNKITFFKIVKVYI